jgi:hypothetical protein
MNTSPQPDSIVPVLAELMMIVSVHVIGHQR